MQRAPTFTDVKNLTLNDPTVDANEAIRQGKSVSYYAHNGDFRVDLTVIPIGTKVDTVTVLDFSEKRTLRPQSALRPKVSRAEAADLEFICSRRE